MAARLGPRVAQLLLLTGIVIAVAVVYRETADGVGEGHDTSHYLSAATNLRDGRGLTVAFSSGFDPVDTATALEHYERAPLTHYPPGYPVAIAFTDLVLPGGIGAAARALGLVTVVTTAVAAFVLARAMSLASLAAAGVAWAAVLTPSALHLSMWAMSDGLAAALTLAAIAAAADSVRRPDRRRAATELLAGFLAAGAASTRYNGAAAAIGVLALVLLTRPSRRERLAGAVRAVGPTVLVLLIEAAVTATSDTSPRPLAWHPVGRDDLRALVDVIGMWLVGAKSHMTIRAAAAVLVVAGIAAAWPPLRAAVTDRRHLTTNRAIGVAIAAYVLAQLGAVVVTSSLLDADVTADRRIMVPIELLAVVVGCVFIARLLPATLTPAAFAALVALRLAVPTGALPEGIATPDMGRPTAQLYQMVADLPADTIIVTNVPESLWRDTRRPSIVAPARHDKLSGRAIADLPGRLREMGRLVGARDGLLVLEEPRIFGIPVDSPRELNPSEVAAYLPCAQLFLEAAEGSIYDLSACAGASSR